MGTAPTLARVSGRIASENTYESPVTGLRAVAFVWRLVVRRDVSMDPLNPYKPKVDSFTQIAGVVCGEDLDVKTRWGTLHVAMEGLNVKPPGGIRGVVPLDRPPPIPELVAPFEASRYAVSLQELPLCRGDLVRVIGFIERLPGADAAGDTDAAEYRSRRDLGRVQLIDLSLTDT